MKALVTGGAGFIGSHVVDELISMGLEVFTIDDMSGGYLENVNPRACFLSGDIVDAPAIESFFSHFKFDYVFHTAAYAAEGLSHFIRNYNYTNNVLGSVNLINSSIRHGVKRFIFTSSISVYGNQVPPFHEGMTPKPEDPYAVAKYCIEMDLAIASRTHGLNYTVFRPHNVYGERQNLSDPYRNVVGIFMRQMLLDEPVTVFGDGEQRRAFSHISDVAPAIAHSIESITARNETFNIGGDIPFTINALIGILESELGKKSKVVRYPERDEVKDAYALHDKASYFLGRSKPMELQEGIRRMAEWAKTYDFTKSTSTPTIEITENLPSKWLKEEVPCSR